MNLKKIMSFILIPVMLAGTGTIKASASETAGKPLNQKYSAYEGRKVSGEYVDMNLVSYYSGMDYSSYQIVDHTIEIGLDKITANGTQAVVTGLYEEREAFLWTREYDFIEFDIDIPENGLYQIEFDYYLQQNSSNPAKRTLHINGIYPFVEASDIVFYRYFRDKGEPVVNTLGDETRPSQVEIPGWRTTKLMDTSGKSDEEFKFYFEKGKHTIKMNYTQDDMAVSGVRIVAPTDILSYNEVKQQYIENGYKKSSQTISIEAETNTLEKNSPTLRRETDGDPTINPRSITDRKLNTMGGYRWRYGNQEITWQFTVPEDGLYKIGIRAKQSWNEGLSSYRQIEIDGQVPFQEMMAYEFKFNTKWWLETLSDKSGNPYEFYLTAGTHTISMTVKLGYLSDILESIIGDIDVLSSALMKITLLAGSSPDPNYDYLFFEKIPSLIDDFNYITQSMQWKYDEMNAKSDKLPSMANNFLTIKSQVESMLRDPYSIASRMSDLTSAQESLSAWYTSLQSQPLIIDFIRFGPADEYWKNEVANIFDRMWTTISNFFVSFTKDYDNVGGILDESVEVTNVINVWIARGTEWAEIIKELADEDFTPYSGIAINVNVLPAGQLTAGNVNALMLSVTSGRAPDVALGIDSTSPVEFAIRDAVYDLSKMNGFDEVKERFVEATLTPYKYNDGIFALPETMDFNVLFYRKDILSHYNIQIPDTWEQMFNFVLPALYQNGLEFYFARDFTQFLFQNGGEFYTENGLRSALDSPEAYKAFEQYTGLFTSYNVPQTANFYMRMRTGTMPLGVGNFNLYMQLSVAAPELAGKWGVAPLPGVMLPDGTIDRTAGAITAQGDIILKQSNSPDDSWEFLKWWSSAETQTRFARELEALIGSEARWNTANKEAFLNLSWDREDVEVLQEQWVWAKETPVVLGGYFTTRHLTNAWTTVVISGGDVRDALEQAVKDINRELRMKQEEYGISIEGDN